jgi:hypothetical protein
MLVNQRRKSRELGVWGCDYTRRSTLQVFKECNTDKLTSTSDRRWSAIKEVVSRRLQQEKYFESMHAESFRPYPSTYLRLIYLSSRPKEHNYEEQRQRVSDKCGWIRATHPKQASDTSYLQLPRTSVSRSVTNFSSTISILPIKDLKVTEVGHLIIFHAAPLKARSSHTSSSQLRSSIAFLRYWPQMSFCQLSLGLSFIDSFSPTVIICRYLSSNFPCLL